MNFFCIFFSSLYEICLTSLLLHSLFPFLPSKIPKKSQDLCRKSNIFVHLTDNHLEPVKKNVCIFFFFFFFFEKLNCEVPQALGEDVHSHKYPLLLVLLITLSKIDNLKDKLE